MTRILLVEDEPDVASFIRQGLDEEGYAVTWVSTGREALEHLRGEASDLVLLDVQLPDMTGLEVCRRLRIVRPTLPVIMLTALDAVEDKVRGLRAGADDYVPKPFAFVELLARMEALLRRARNTPYEGLFRDGALTLDPVAHTCRCGARELSLTPKEFDLLAFFLGRRNEALSREVIHREVWGHDFDRGTNLIDVYVNYLRHKLAEAGCASRIDTVRGIGYRYVPAGEDADG
ncbi:response regulator transcription factor [Rhodocaloribacter sp.]